jgi:ATP-dependent Clp protease adaptor protein ClpS
MTATLELPKTALPGSGIGDGTKIIVLNDNHNTFDSVASALSKVLPPVNYEKGLALATEIDSKGLAVVWTGVKEVAELYWEQLNEAGLTMAALE